MKNLQSRSLYNQPVIFRIYLFIVLCFLLCSCSSTKRGGLEPGTYNKLERYTRDLTITKLREKMIAGEITAESLVRFYLDRIDTQNPTLRAVISTNPDAVEIARELDARIAAEQPAGPLHGMPILVKDNIEAVPMATTAGSLALKDNYTGRDAPLITGLKEAGAIILGKTNLSEWANFRSERSSSGWSGVGGQTRNPIDINKSPCGSSAGSGAAVAANLAIAAVGTETNGSITCPASANGIVGFKPTVGLISGEHVVPVSNTQDTAGPMTRSVHDAALLLAAMQKKNSAPAIEVPEPNTQSLAKSRLGVIYSSALEHEGVAAVFGTAMKKIRSTGVSVTPGLRFKPYPSMRDDGYAVMQYQFKNNINEYLAGLPNNLKDLNLDKLIEFNLKHKDSELKFFQQEIWLKSQPRGSLKEKAYKDALRRLQTRTRAEGMDYLLRKHRLHALVTATLGPAWSIDRINGDHYPGGFSNYPAAAGYPHITIPMGTVHGLPVGLSITAEAGSENRLLAFAQEIETLLKG